MVAFISGNLNDLLSCYAATPKVESVQNSLCCKRTQRDFRIHTEGSSYEFVAVRTKDGFKEGDVLSSREPPQRKRRSGVRSPEKVDAKSPLVRGRRIEGYRGECARMSGYSGGQQNRRQDLQHFLQLTPQGLGKAFRIIKKIRTTCSIHHGRARHTPRYDILRFAFHG